MRKIRQCNCSKEVFLNQEMFTSLTLGVGISYRSYNRTAVQSKLVETIVYCQSLDKTSMTTEDSAEGTRRKNLLFMYSNLDSCSTVQLY
jgi:hypothetical protein